MNKDLKNNLWYGRTDSHAAWYDRGVIAPCTATIQTEWGEGLIEVKGDYCLEFRLNNLISIHRVDYEVHCYLNLRLSTEEYELSNSSRRVVRIKDNGERVFAGSPTEKAGKTIYSTIKPILIAWAEANAGSLVQGYSLKYQNQIILARHKLDKIGEEIAQRRQWLDIVEKELRENGGISDEDKYRLNDIWGSSWTFK